MLNAEKYKKQIEENGYLISVNKNSKEIVPCKNSECIDCLFDTVNDCAEKIIQWLITESE